MNCWTSLWARGYRAKIKISHFRRRFCLPAPYKLEPIVNKFPSPSFRTMLFRKRADIIRVRVNEGGNGNVYRKMGGGGLKSYNNSKTVCYKSAYHGWKSSSSSSHHHQLHQWHPTPPPALLSLPEYAESFIYTHAQPSDNVHTLY